MRVTIKLFATLRTGRFGTETTECGPGTTVAHIVEKLKIPNDEVAIIFINGRHAELIQELRDGDTLSLFPPVGGG